LLHLISFIFFCVSLLISIKALHSDTFFVHSESCCNLTASRSEISLKSFL
jgi:hypothetical protein